MPVIEYRVIEAAERAAFEQLAIEHFREMNPDFTPHDDWKQAYFPGILANEHMMLCWIVADGDIAGFILYGIEQHRFLPRKFGMIYEVYIIPVWRRHGLGRGAAVYMIEDLRKRGVSKIQLEVMRGNEKAARLWEAAGFSEVCSKYARSQ